MKILKMLTRGYWIRRRRRNWTAPRVVVQYREGIDISIRADRVQVRLENSLEDGGRRIFEVRAEETTEFRSVLEEFMRTRKPAA